MTKPANKPEKVNDYMAKLDHPFKAEVQLLRDIIKGVNGAITEEIKWNAPSYGYKEYMVTFNLRATNHIHLVFHNTEIVKIKSDLLEGDYRDRRMTYFSDRRDVETKKAAFESVLRELIELIDQKAEE